MRKVSAGAKYFYAGAFIGLGALESCGVNPVDDHVVLMLEPLGHVAEEEIPDDGTELAD